MWRPRFVRFVRLPRSPARIRADVDEELRFDVEMRARDLMREGMTAESAWRLADAEFGDLEATRRYCEEIDMQTEHEVRRTNFMQDLRSDLTLAVRGMRRAPTFSVVVLLTLALGIGANAAIFSVVERVLLAPLPFASPEQLYRLYTTPNGTDGDYDKLSAVELLDLAKESRSISGLTLFGWYGGVSYSDDHQQASWQQVSVAPNFFDVLGLRPVAGRVFSPDDYVIGTPPAAMISYQIWQQMFAGSPDVVGKSMQLNGRPTKIVGVLPESFVGPTFDADVLRPLNPNQLTADPRNARSRVYRSVARLKDGVSLAQWRSELAVFRTRMQAEYPEIKNAGVFIPMPLHEAIVGRAGPVLRLVMIGALVVLLAACVNIAGLFLSRAAARRRELGVRIALGAGRMRIVRQIVSETLLYSIAGGAVGVAFAVVLKRGLLAMAGPMLPKLGEIRIDFGALVFATVAALVCGVLVGLIPAFAATGVDVREAIGDSGSRAGSRGAGASRLSRLLVSAQVTLAIVLVVGAGLLMRTFRTLVDTNLGYDTTDHQAAFFVSLGARYRSVPAREAFVSSFIEGLHALPGVSAAGYTVTGPWNGAWQGVNFHVDGRVEDAATPSSVVLATASSEFLKAVGIPVLRGRGFTAGDRVGAAPVVVISESMARKYWPNADPVGARIHLRNVFSDPADTALDWEVVGVVGDVREDALSAADPTLYVPAEETEVYGSSFVVRTTGSARELLPMITATLHRMDPRVLLLAPMTMRDVLSNLVRRQNVAMTLIGCFAALALLLAGLGVYAVTAFGVVARTREFGIRAALGGSRGAVLRLVLRDSMVSVVPGVIVGLLLAAALSRLVASLLVHVTPHDPITFIAAPLVLAAVALAAALVPARAAMRIEPVEALRLE